jgi:hypothetical protein
VHSPCDVRVYWREILTFTSTSIFGVHSSPRLPRHTSRSFHIGYSVRSSFLEICSFPRTASFTNGLGAWPMVLPFGARRPVASTISITISPKSSAFSIAGSGAMDIFESDLGKVNLRESCFLRGEAASPFLRGEAYERVSGRSGDGTPPVPFSTPAAVSSGFNRRP